MSKYNGSFTEANNPKGYHRAICNMTISALKFAEKDGVDAMYSALRKTQMKNIIDTIVDGSLPREAEVDCVLKTLEDMYDESAKYLGEQPYGHKAGS